MALPTSGISVSMVKSAIGAGTNNVGQLCTHPNINKWSKKKPVILDSVAPDRSSSWWRSTSGNCGLIIPNFSSISALISHVEANGADWAYQKPTGGSTSPYRLGDFGGYEHTARRTFSPNTPAQQYHKDTTYAPISMNTITPSQYELSPSDIGNAFNIGNMYFGVALSQGGAYKHITEVDTIMGAGGGGIELPISTFTQGVYNIYMIAATIKKTTFDSTATGVFIPIPNGKFTIEILNIYKVRLYVTGEITGGIKKTLNLTVYLENNDTIQHTRSGITIGWRYGDNTIQSPSETGENSEYIASITANAESFESISFNKMGALPQFDTRGGYLYLLCNSHPEIDIERQEIDSIN